MARIAILGLGLMGGSLGLALRKAGDVVAGYTRNPERRREALACGAVDAVFDSAAGAVADAELIVLGAPILQIPPLAREAIPAIRKGAILTDVGSTKAYLESELAEPLRQAGVHWLGSHPIAGSEQQGIQAARADLYQDAMVVMTPTASTPPRVTEEVKALWTRVGARTVCMGPQEHDDMLARTSHLPHLAAALVAWAVAREGSAKVAGFCGGGFRDTSRVAEGAPSIWMDILATNRDAIIRELRAFSDVTRRMLEGLENGSLDSVENMLDTARLSRRAIVRESGERRAAGENE